MSPQAVSLQKFIIRLCDENTTALGGGEQARNKTVKNLNNWPSAVPG